MVYENKCVACSKNFLSKAVNAKTCSEKCFIEHRKHRRANLRKNSTKEWKCRRCSNTFYRPRKRNGFCSRSCASKYNITTGSCDKWLMAGAEYGKSIKKPLKELTCQVCNKKYKIKQKEYKRNRSKTCSTKCKHLFLSKKFSGSGNPFFGKNHTKAAIEKQKKTLRENHGVSNAYALAKRKTISKGQRELFELVKSIIPDKKILLEKRVAIKPNSIFADILLPDDKIVIEYNGDFWHCNPEIYDKNYFNPKKQMLAKNIWKQDEKRNKTISESGYRIIVVWEKDFKKNKSLVQSVLKEKILESK